MTDSRRSLTSFNFHDYDNMDSLQDHGPLGQKKELLSRMKGKKANAYSRRVFLATRHGSAKLNDFQESITSARSSKSKEGDFV
jgi:hypothetical protein